MADDVLLKYKIALEMIPMVGSITAKKLIAYCGGVEEVFTHSKKSLLRIPGIGDVLSSQISQQKVLDRAQREIDFMEKYGIQPVYFTDQAYPDRLRHCEDSPTMLYFKGNVNLSSAKMLSVVGTRNSTDYGRLMCDELIGGLAQNGHEVVVVSGLAHGIDTYAHRAALRNNLPTVAVLAHGLDRIYPSANKQMAREMLANGGLITDFITGTEPERNNFLRRNRIIAGIADATLVVESGEKGGALVTADLAHSYNRDILACPGRTTDKSSKGCNSIIKSNKAALVESAADIENALNWFPSKSQPVKQAQLSIFKEFSAVELQVIDSLKSSDMENIDHIALNCGLSMASTSATLLSLEFDGVVKSHPGKMYSLSKSYKN